MWIWVMVERVRPVVALAVAALTIVCAAGLAEALEPDHYTPRTTNFTVSPQAFGGNYLSCPTGDRIVTGGGFWHKTSSSTPIADAGLITNSTPTTDGKGWYATGQNSFTHLTVDLEEVALCLPLKQVGKYSVKTADFPVSPSMFGGSYLSCAKGDRIVAGGAFWHAMGSGTPLADAGYIANSTPTTDGKGWYATGDNVSSQTIDLEEVALCLPLKQVGKYAVKTRNFTFFPFTFGGGHLSCPKRDRIVAGGAFWHPKGSGTPLADGGFIANSTPTTNGERWYATGDSLLSAGPQLEEVALCL